MIEGYITSIRIDRNSNGREMMLCVPEDILAKPLSHDFLFNKNVFLRSTYFRPICTPQKYQKTKGFLTFLVVIEMKHGLKWAKLHKKKWLFNC